MKYWLSLLMVLLLTGCAHTVYVTKIKLVVPEDHLLVDCEVVPPPARDAYKKASPDKREEMMFDFSDKELLSITSCNVRWQALREWKKKQQEIHTGPEKKGL